MLCGFEKLVGARQVPRVIGALACRAGEALCRKAMC